MATSTVNKNNHRTLHFAFSKDFFYTSFPVLLFYFAGTFRVRDLLVDPDVLRDQIVAQNISLDADVINALLDADVNATEVGAT